MWVRFLLAGPLGSHSIKALHYIGNVETVEHYHLRAPLDKQCKMQYNTLIDTIKGMHADHHGR